MRNFGFIGTVAAIVAVLLLGATPGSAQICGDLDDSGAITVVDALRVLRVAVGRPVALSCPPLLDCGQFAVDEETCFSDAGASVEVDVPVVGEVPTRGEGSYYAAGLTPGETYTVSVHPVSRAGQYPNLQAYLRVFMDAGYGLEHDCTFGQRKTSCSLETSGTVYFSVAAGPLNRAGETFLILITR